MEAEYILGGDFGRREAEGKAMQMGEGGKEQSGWALSMGKGGQWVWGAKKLRIGPAKNASCLEP
jgi:hypothetical protein